MAQLPEAVQAAEQARSNRESGIMDLFGEVEEVQRKPAKPVKPWSDEVRLKGEKIRLAYISLVTQLMFTAKSLKLLFR